MAKTIKAKEDFLWFKRDQIIPEQVYQTNWENHVIITNDSIQLNEFDLNKDGIVDKKDSEIASKVLNTIKKGKK